MKSDFNVTGKSCRVYGGASLFFAGFSKAVKTPLRKSSLSRAIFVATYKDVQEGGCCSDENRHPACWIFYNMIKGQIGNSFRTAFFDSEKKDFHCLEIWRETSTFTDRFQDHRSYGSKSSKTQGQAHPLRDDELRGHPRRQLLLCR